MGSFLVWGQGCRVNNTMNGGAGQNKYNNLVSFIVWGGGSNGGGGRINNKNTVKGGVGQNKFINFKLETIYMTLQYI